jgi:hypothetical protein
MDDAIVEWQRSGEELSGL